MKNLLAFGARATRRLSGFAITVVLMAVSSLVLVPATIGAAGLETWSSIVLAQALALIVQAVAGCGYGVNGPSIVATGTAEESVQYFRAAQRTRLVVALPCYVLMICAMVIIPNPNPIAGLVSAGYLAIGTFSALFFYIGRSAPAWLLFAETIPRATFIFAGAISLSLGVPLLIGLALPAVGAVLAVAISNITIFLSARGTAKPGLLEFSGVGAELRRQLAPTAVTLLQAGRDALPVLVVTAAAAELLGVYGIFDRIQRQAVTALGPVTSTLQGWVPRRLIADNSPRAAKIALTAALAGTPFVILIATLVGPTFIGWLSAGALSPTFGQTLLFATVIATNMLIQIILYACLVPLGGIAGVIWSNVVGIISIAAAIPAMVAIDRSATLVLGAVVVGNTVQVAVQILLFRVSIARSKHTGVH